MGILPFQQQHSFLDLVGNNQFLEIEVICLKMQEHSLSSYSTIQQIYNPQTIHQQQLYNLFLIESLQEPNIIYKKTLTLYHLVTTCPVSSLLTVLALIFPCLCIILPAPFFSSFFLESSRESLYISSSKALSMIGPSIPKIIIKLTLNTSC